MGKRTFKYDKVLCRKFGQKVAFLRKEADITQEELAFRANISTSYLSSIERGITDTTISTVKRLGKALNIELNEFFIF
ncbi:helix-turn-helix transcriptional regulator [bacterium]|nr:helix-turn-helix transcriptional regulator [bacterium]